MLHGMPEKSVVTPCRNHPIVNNDTNGQTHRRLRSKQSDDATKQCARGAQDRGNIIQADPSAD